MSALHDFKTLTKHPSHVNYSPQIACIVSLSSPATWASRSCSAWQRTVHCSREETEEGITRTEMNEVSGDLSVTVNIWSTDRRWRNELKLKLCETLKTNMRERGRAGTETKGKIYTRLEANPQQRTSYTWQQVRLSNILCWCISGIVSDVFKNFLSTDIKSAKTEMGYKSKYNLSVLTAKLVVSINIHTAIVQVTNNLYNKR